MTANQKQIDEITLTEDDIKYLNEEYPLNAHFLAGSYLWNKKSEIKKTLLENGGFICSTSKFNKKEYDEDFFEDGHGYDENTFRFADIICKYDIHVDISENNYVLLDESLKNTIKMNSDEFDAWWLTKTPKEDYCTFIGAIFDLERAF